MVNKGVVQQDSTVRFMFSTAAADGGEENFSATLEEADVVVRKSGTNLTLDASTITITNVATGLYEVAIDLSNDADLSGDQSGAECWVYVDPNDETIDAQAVSGVLGCFRIETLAEQAIRLYFESVYPTGCTIATVTGNTTGRINLTDVLDAQSADADQVGKIFTVWDATNGQVHDVQVTSVQGARLFNVVNAIDGSVMDFTVAAGDRVWQKDVVAAALIGNQSAYAAARVADLNNLADADIMPVQNGTFTFQFDMVDATDGITPEPGKTVTVERSIDGAAFAAATGTVTEIEEGAYEMAASTDDMNGGVITFKMTATGCATRFYHFITTGGV